MRFVNAKSILSSNNGTCGMNLFRGCTHGCIYCDARSKCYHTPEPFEDIEVKINAPQLLENALIKKRKKSIIGTGAMSDPYLHAEQKLLLTRKCLEIIDNHQFGLAIQTKSDLILRDLDLIESINKKSKAVVQMTLTTFDEKLCKIIEPNVCTTYQRFQALKIFQQSKIPTVVWITPLLPFINDSLDNLKGLLDYCAEAGVKGIIDFGMGLTLREGDREYFYSKLDKHFPNLKQEYLNRYGWNSYELPSPNSKKLIDYFHDFCEKNKIMHTPNQVFAYMNDLPEEKNLQLSLF